MLISKAYNVYCLLTIIDKNGFSLKAAFVCLFSFLLFIQFLKRLSTKGNVSDREGREVSEGGEGIYSFTLERIIRIYELYH